MLHSLRTKMEGWPTMVVLGVSVFAVAFFGIENYLQGDRASYLAKVGDTEIQQQDYQERVNNIREQMMAQQGDRYDPTYLEQPATKQKILDAMISQAVLRQANGKLGLTVTDAQVVSAIAAEPAFQSDGKFDQKAYGAYLAGTRTSASTFEAQRRQEMATQLIPNAIGQSVLVTDADIDRVLRLTEQKRDVRLVDIPAPAAPSTDVSDAELKAYYDAHRALYMTPEQVTLQYIEVNAKDLKDDAPPSDADLRGLYEQQKSRYVQPEQREVSHILVNVPKNATPEQQKAALEKARKIAAEATPANFATLAAQNSDDLGSKRQGGDLGFIEKGVANASFDAALFAMKKGEISQPVLSPDEGYHIIYLRDVRSGAAKPFEEVRGDILAKATADAHGRKYNEVAGHLADEAYQSPSSLEPAAKASSLPLQTTEPFGRDGGKGIAANPKVIAAAFSDDVLAQGNNSGLIDLGDNHGVVIHVDKHTPSVAKPLSEVQAVVRQAVIDDRIVAQAKKQADELVARAQKGEDLTAIANAAHGQVKTVAGVTRGAQDQPPMVVQAIFAQPRPADGKPALVAVPMEKGAYTLVAVDKVIDGDTSKVTAEERAGFRQQMGQAVSAAQTLAFIEAMKAKTEVKISKDRL